MDESRAAVSEVVPWHLRTVRRLRSASVGLGRWVSGWGVGGVFIAGLIAIVVGYLVLASVGKDHVATTPCHQAAPLVDRLQTMQDDERGVALDRSAVRELHRIGVRLTPVADDAYGSLADVLKSLAATASQATVGQRLHAEDALSQESDLCF